MKQLFLGKIFSDAMHLIVSILFHLVKKKSQSHPLTCLCESKLSIMADVHLVPIMHLLEPPPISVTAVVESSRELRLTSLTACPCRHAVHSFLLWILGLAVAPKQLPPGGLGELSHPRGSPQPVGTEVGRQEEHLKRAQQQMWSGRRVNVLEDRSIESIWLEEQS